MPSLMSDLFSLPELEASQSPRRSSSGAENLEILIKGLDMDASDPRDKLFAMLQFGRETVQLNTLPAAVRPDYGKSVAQVFSDLTRWWIVTHRSLRILSAIQAESGRTWQWIQQPEEEERTTRLRRDRPTWSLGYYGQSNYARSILGLAADIAFRAAGASAVDTALISQRSAAAAPHVLPLRGIRLGLIPTIAPFPHYDDRRAAGAALHAAYARIFDPVTSAGTWVLARSFRNMRAADAVDSLRAQNEVSHQEAHADYARETGAVECHGECWFTTDGGVTGLCPWFVRAGDVVVVLFGGRFPFVLRASQSLGELAGVGGGRVDRYEYLSECFVGRYMYGRAIDERHEMLTASEVFEET